MDSETMLMPVLDGEALKEVEATFLCGGTSVVACHGENHPFSVLEIRPLGTHERPGIDYQPLMPTVRTTSHRCC